MRKKIIWLAPLLIALMALAFPATAFADGGGGKTALDCSLTLAVLDPGTVTITAKGFKTTGEKTAGALVCPGAPSLSGAFSTNHSSKVKVAVDGSFQGKLKGTFGLDIDGDLVPDLTGDIKAKISGSVIGLAPAPPFPAGTPVHSVTDTGKWKFDEDDVKGGGKFTITLVGVVGLPASLGGLVTPAPGSLTGKVKADD